MKKKVTRLVLRYRPKSEVEQLGEHTEPMSKVAKKTLRGVSGGPLPVLRVRPASRNGSPVVQRKRHGQWDQVYIVVEGSYKGRTGTKAQLGALGQVEVVGGRHAQFKDVGKR